MDHVDLYSAVLTTSPIILLAVSGGIVFGPVPARSRHRAWSPSRWVLFTDVSAAFLVVGAAAVCLLVLAGWVGDSSTTRSTVVGAEGLALLLLLLHVLSDIAALHSAEPHEGKDPTGRRNAAASDD